MTRRRWLVVLGVAVAAVAIVSSYGSEGRALTDVLTRAAAALSATSGESDGARTARLQNELGDLLTSQVEVRIPELWSGKGRATVVQNALALSRGKHPMIGLSAIAIRVEGRERASASFRVSLSESQAGDLHARTRNGHAGFVKTALGWQIESVVIEAETSAEPEPRP